jgi:exopolysaccharide biosynthesis polyprenyl glycosylphosphotransferase
MKEKFPSRYAYIVFLTDLLVINLAFLGTSFLRFDSIYPPGEFREIYITLNVCVNIAYPLLLILCGAYRDIYRSSLGHQALTVIKASIWSSLAIAAYVILSHQYGYSRFFIFSYLLLTMILLPFLRIIHYSIIDFCLKRGVGLRKVLITGDREILFESYLRVQMQPHLGFRVEGVIPPEWDAKGLKNIGIPILENPEALERAIPEQKISHIFIFDREIDESKYSEFCALGRRHGLEVRAIPSLTIFPDLRTRIHDIMGFPLVISSSSALEGKEPLVKKLFDLAVSSATLLLLSPIFLTIAALIKLDSKGPVFYRQKRIGNGGKEFTMLKFRSMVQGAEQQKTELNDKNEASGPLFKIRNDPRVTRMGKFLRRTSSDELPQLINVLLGDLSLVGPRPGLAEEITQYREWQKRRLSVPQGVTGLWQVSGRSRLSFDEMTLLDLYYIDKWSLMLDIEILIETVPAILHGDGAF